MKLPETTREIKIIRGNQIDSYSVNINTRRVGIFTRATEFTDLLLSISFRYPKNSFAVICGTNLEQTDLCANFLEKLDDVQSLSSYGFPGNGNIPYPDTSSGNWNNTVSRYFIYDDENMLEEAIHLKVFTRENLKTDDETQ